MKIEKILNRAIKVANVKRKQYGQIAAAYRPGNAAGRIHLGLVGRQLEAADRRVLALRNHLCTAKLTILLRAGLHG